MRSPTADFDSAASRWRERHRHVEYNCLQTAPLQFPPEGFRVQPRVGYPSQTHRIGVPLYQVMDAMFSRRTPGVKRRPYTTGHRIGGSIEPAQHAATQGAFEVWQLVKELEDVTQLGRIETEHRDPRFAAFRHVSSSPSASLR